MKKALKIDSIENIRVIVTAGAAGLGRTIAQTFLLNGATVCVCDISDMAISDIRDANPGILAQHADVSDYKQASAFFDLAVRSMGGLDVLVNNAGMAGPTSLIENISPEDWGRTIDVNLNGAFYFSKWSIPILKSSGGGAIINIASSAALFGYPRRSAYAASKWALIGMTKTMAMEAGPFNIRVNAICPGSIKGPRIEKVIENDARIKGVSTDVVRQTYLKQVSLNSFVDAQDVANMAVFLASEYGKIISGQALGVDGHTESLSDAVLISNKKFSE